MSATISRLQTEVGTAQRALAAAQFEKRHATENALSAWKARVNSAKQERDNAQADAASALVAHGPSDPQTIAQNNRVTAAEAALAAAQTAPVDYSGEDANMIATLDLRISQAQAAFDAATPALTAALA